MKVTFGHQPETIPEGMLTSIRFPTLTMLNTPTGEMVARLIQGDGFSTRDLPLTIYFQETQAAGHDGAVMAGALHEVTIDGKNVSGRGYLLKNANGKRAALAVKTGSMRGNSADLAEVDVELTIDETNNRLLATFKKSKLAATTIVGTPAFGQAHAVIDDERLSDADEDLVAALIAPETELVCDAPFELRVIGGEDLVASGAPVQPYEAFFQPETDTPKKVTPDEHGWVSGHLALWESCHDGIEGQCTRVPRPLDGYASFNKPGVLTDQGLVETGPIFLHGGHAYGPDLEKAYGGIENAWADVRVTPGLLGPWVSGVVRPGISDEMLYAARASRISGHWKGGRLKAIVSVNAEGFDVPGSGQLVASFTTDADNAIDDLFVGLSCAEPLVASASSALSWLASANPYTYTTSPNTNGFQTYTCSSAPQPDPEPEETIEVDPELLRAATLLVLAAEDDEV